MTRIANPLRMYAQGELMADWLKNRHSVRDKLLRIADEIDAENSRRMEQSRRDTRRASCKYLGSVLNDYKRGVKRPKHPWQDE